tara:strand:- start:1223 stop:2086 length:864 start_codon:yes stop_codon:yes gene_type:complete
MPKKINTISLCASKNNSKISEIALQAFEVLTNLKKTVYLHKNLASLQKTTKCKISVDQDILKSDLIVVIGGDGSILGFAREYGSKGVSVLGINLGNLGFLADIAPENIVNSVIDVVEGNYLEDQRFFLEANFENSNTVEIALNEIVIKSTPKSKLLEYELYIDNLFVYRQKGDGLIVSTPTGSTAYSLSGGGPIIHPSLKAITLLPMFPHSLTASPLVIDHKSHIRLVVKNKASVSLDGQNNFSLKKGETIFIKKSLKPVTLIHPEDHNFFSACRNKLGWSSGIVKD